MMSTTLVLFSLLTSSDLSTFSGAYSCTRSGWLNAS